jgi:hypothetical protein
MKKLFLTAILMMMAILAFADEVVIGTGTITSYSPFDVGSGYARSASLYTSTTRLECRNCQTHYPMPHKNLLETNHRYLADICKLVNHDNRCHIGL